MPETKTLPDGRIAIEVDESIVRMLSLGDVIGLEEGEYGRVEVLDFTSPTAIVVVNPKWEIAPFAVFTPLLDPERQ